MTKSFLRSTLSGLLAAALLALPVWAGAKDTNAPAIEKKAAKEAKPQKNSRLPFHGKLKAVDKAAKTISVGEMTLQITSETIITKGDKPATLDDGVVGEDASGSYLKGDDGKLNVGKLRFGPKPGATEKAAKPEPKKEKPKKD